MVEKKVIEKQKEIKEFRAAHGDTKVGEVTVNMVYCMHLCLTLLVLNIT